MAQKLHAVALACTLSPSPKESSSVLLGQQVLDQLEKHGVSGELIRAVDHNISPGMETDMGDGDDWPAIRDKILAADILLISTPIWLGHPCSISQRILERLNADLSTTDDQERPIMFDKVGIVAVVGNEDGAHKTASDLFQGLSEVGFTIPAQADTYWVGEAMQGVDFKDHEETPEKTAGTTATVARNAAHLAGLLKTSGYPAS